MSSTCNTSYETVQGIGLRVANVVRHHLKAVYSFQSFQSTPVDLFIYLRGGCWRCGPDDDAARGAITAHVPR